MKLQIGVLFGGKSVEHDISIITALQVMSALDKDLYEVIPLYLDKQNRLFSHKSLMDLSTFKVGVEHDPKKEEIFIYKQEGTTYYRPLKKRFANGAKIDLILPLVHGMGVEDGTVAGMLEIIGVPYSSAKVASSALAQDKAWTKDILKAKNIDTLPYILSVEELSDKSSLIYPLIVKPSRLGSSIGIKVVRDYDELVSSYNQAKLYDEKVIIEPYLENYKEFNCAVLKSSKGYIPSQVEEIKVQNEYYAFYDKYEEDSGIEMGKISDTKNRNIPANITDAQKKEIQDLSVQICQVFELRGIVRIDFLYCEATSKLYVNEINTIPGSLGFYLFEKAGISFPELLNQLIKATLIEHQKNSKLITSFSSNVLNKKTLNFNK